MRKIIQVAVRESDRDNYPAIVALCDDGSVWITSLNVWVRVADIPQDVTIAELPIEPEPPKTWHETMGLYGGPLDP